MGRPSKKGLDWFKRNVDYYEDFKIMDLINEYGPLGATVFDCLLCMIYREGYYLELPLEKVALAVVKAIGSKWIKKHQVLQVIQYCADIDLLHKDLLARSVVTSAGIQRRYAEVTSRNKVNKSQYWLIDKDGQLLITIPSDGISATETPISATETPVNDAEMPQEKYKNNKKNKEREKIAAGAASPTLYEVKDYCEQNNFKVNPVRFWNYYAARGWKSKGDVIENWQVLLNNWEENEQHAAGEPDAAHQPSYDLDEYEKYDIFDAKEKQK